MMIFASDSDVAFVFDVCYTVEPSSMLRLNLSWE